MSLAIVLSNVHLDYTKKDGSPVNANVVTLGHMPRNDFESKGRNGLVVKEFYIRSDDIQYGEAASAFTDGEILEMDYLEDRFGRCHFLRCQSTGNGHTLDKLFKEGG